MLKIPSAKKYVMLLPVHDFDHCCMPLYNLLKSGSEILFSMPVVIMCLFITVSSGY